MVDPARQRHERAYQGGPRVVALGGGHGLSVALRAIRRYAGEVTGVVSTADDGGSSGRLRRDLGVPAPGDARRCLVALAERREWAEAFEHRFDGGDLNGHALGNLVLAGLCQAAGGFTAALELAGELLGAVGRVLPATAEPVVLKAEVGGEAPEGQVAGSRIVEGRVMDGRIVEGQVAVARSPGRIRRVELIPPDATAEPAAVAAILAADQVVLAPGSLYTSLLPVLAVTGIRAAVRATPARVIQVCNLAVDVPETEGIDGPAHLAAVLDHGARVDVLLAALDGALACPPDAVAALGVELVTATLAAPATWAAPATSAAPATLAAPGGQTHDPERLASALAALL